MPRSKNELKGFVRRVYQGFADRGEEFNLATVRDAVLLRADQFADGVLEAAVDAALAQVDDEESRGGVSLEVVQDTLPGFRIDRVYRLGEGRRQPERTAMIHHAQEHIAIQRKHADDAKASADKELDEFIQLSPYWGPGVTKEDAIAAYGAANP